MDITKKLNTSIGNSGIAYPPRPRRIKFGLNILYPFYFKYLSFIKKLSQKYGDIVAFNAGQEEIFLVNDLGFIEHILITNPDNYLRGTGFSRLRMILGDGLLSTDGAIHKRHRTMMQPSFHKKSIEDYTAVMSGCVDEFILSIDADNSRSIDIQNESVDLFSKVIARLLLGEKNEAKIIELGKFFDSLTYNYKAFILIGLPNIAKRLPLKWAKDFYRLNSELDTMMYTAITEARKNPDKATDIMNLLITAKDTEGGSMSDKEIRDELATLFFAAYDTSARTLTWSLYLLSKNKNILDKFLSLKNDPAAYNEYANLILSETLRIYPPAHSITRITDKNDLYNNTNIPGGTSIIIAPYLLHRDERFFDKPMDFIPERWSKDSKKHISRMTYLPFGAGKRSCIGEAFARMQVSIALQRICAAYEFDIPSNVKESSALTLKPAEKMIMTLKRREYA
jgi:cytochrome P450